MSNANEPEKLNKPRLLHTDVELDFDQKDLDGVAISDANLEDEDKKTAQALREAKKTAKKLRTPEEKKAYRRKKILLSGLAVLVGFAVLFAVPFTRWTILNIIGFRSTFVVTVSEEASKKPVTGAIAKIGEAQTTTDTYGRATFANTKFGNQLVTLQKTGYGQKQTTYTNGFGVTRVAAALKVIGIQLDLDIKDWLSSEPVSNAKASFGEATAVSDKTGRASLVVPPTDSEKIEVEISAAGYTTKTISTKTNIQSREVSLVAASKNYFISKRDGKFDIFSSNLDGSNQQKIIEATGKEDESLLQFSINRNNKQAILIANRDGKIQNGRVIAGVYSIDLEKSSIKKIDEGSDIQLLDWGDSTAVYTKSEIGLNYDDPALNRIMGFNTANSRLNQLAQANYFPFAITAQNKLFYMPADAFRPLDNASLTSHDLASGAKKTFLTERQIGYGSRASYNTLELQDTNGANFELQIANGTTRALDRRPVASLSFSLSPNAQTVTWSDRRDGQGALLVRSVKANDERIALKAGGLTNPIRYITDNLAVVRIATSQETADYVVNISAGKIGKITDVSNVGAYKQGGL